MNNIKWIIMTLSIALLHVAVHGQSASEDEPADSRAQPITIDQWTNLAQPSEVYDRKGQPVTELPRIGMVRATQPVPIDPSKAYQIRGYFRSARPEQLSRVLFDVIYLDADKKKIQPLAVHPITSVSSLVESAEAGTRTLRIAKRDDWDMKTKLRGIAIGAATDYSDLPNSNVATYESISDADDAYEVVLRKPLEESLEVGTQMRLHRYTDYPRVWDNTLSTEWTPMSFTLLPDYVPGERPRHTIWPGAAYISVVIRNHYTNYPEKLPEGAQPPVLLFDDVAVIEVDVQDGVQNEGGNQ